MTRAASELPPVPPDFADIPASVPETEPVAARTPAPAPGIGSEERTWAVAAHLSPLLTFLVPIPGMSIIAPLVIWQMKKTSMPYAAGHAKEALNFNITAFIWLVGAIIAGLALFVLGLLLTVPLVGLIWLILTIVGAVKAGNGERYRYPFTIRFVR